MTNINILLKFKYSGINVKCSISCAKCLLLKRKHNWFFYKVIDIYRNSEINKVFYEQHSNRSKSTLSTIKKNCVIF